MSVSRYVRSISFLRGLLADLVVDSNCKLYFRRHSQCKPARVVELQII